MGDGVGWDASCSVTHARCWWSACWNLPTFSTCRFIYRGLMVYISLFLPILQRLHFRWCLLIPLLFFSHPLPEWNKLLPFITASIPPFSAVVEWFYSQWWWRWDFPGGLDGKESACSAGDPASIPGSARSPGEGNGNPLWYSCLENPMNRGAWQATVHGVTKSWTWLSS